MTSFGRHIRPACNKATVEIFIKKSWFWPPYSVFFMDFRWCEGSGACFERLRMRSRSTRKWAPRNAGDLGVVWRSAHVPTVPFTWLRRAKALGQTAHASNHHAARGLPMNAYVLFPMPDSCTLIGLNGSREHKWWRSNANESRDPKKQYPYCLSRALIG